MQAFNSTAECAAADAFPAVRVFTVAQVGSNVTQQDFVVGGVRQGWAVASAQSVCATFAPPLRRSVHTFPFM